MKRRRASMRDVAEAANVSVSAVSLVTRNRPGVADDTRERVWEAIARLGYEVTDTQNGERAPTIGLLIERGTRPAILDIFYGDVLQGFQTQAQQLGYQVLLHVFDRTHERFENITSSLRDKVQGFVVANDGDITQEMIAQIQRMQLPLVLVENYVPGERIPCVIGDNIVAGYTVTRHLISLGHDTIAVLQGPTKYSSLVDRLRGCLAAVAEAGVLIPTEWMPPPIGGSFERGYLQMQRILQMSKRPTAVVAIHDNTAFGAIEAIKEAGLQIPEDLAIVSIDDVAEAAETRPSLTTFRIPRVEMGQVAMQRLHRLIGGEPVIPVKSIVFGELIVRESCGARRSAREQSTTA